MGRILCLLFLVLFSSCGKNEFGGGQIARFSLTADPTTLDPQKARDLNSITLIHMLFEGLTRTSSTGEAELALAEKVDVDEVGIRYVFHLRKSKWSNGDFVTAYDFEKSWKTILDPNFASDIAYQLYGIKNARKVKLGEKEEIGVKALDGETLVVELEHPIPYFLELVTMPAFFPAKESLYNGPFVLKDWKHSDVVKLKKNPNYWEADHVKLAGVYFYIATPDTALQMFEEGKIDWAGSPLSTIPADAIPSVKRLYISPFLGTAFYRINTDRIKDLKVRRALSLSLDREQIVKHVLPGGAKSAWGLVPPEMGLAKNLNVKLENVQINEPITISYCNSERNALIAQAVQNQWKKNLGLTVQLEAVEPKVFFQRVSKREYQIAMGSWTADFNDPINFLEVFKYKDASTNNTEWENKSYIDLLNRSSVCRSDQERKELLGKAEEILMEEMPIIPIFHFALNYVKNPNLLGVNLPPIGVLDLRNAYFDEVKE